MAIKIPPPTSINEIVNISLSGTTGTCSNKSQVTLSAGGVINYTIRANDTSNNWRTNDIIMTVLDNFNFTISNHNI
jgi:hypothetical protein